MDKDEALKIALKTFEEIYKGCGYVIEDRISKSTIGLAKYVKEDFSLAKYVREDCVKGMDAIKEVLREKNDG